MARLDFSVILKFYEIEGRVDLSAGSLQGVWVPACTARMRAPMNGLIRDRTDSFQ